MIDHKDCRPVPEPLRAALGQALRSLPEAWVLALGRTLPGSFRNKDAILSRVRAVLDGHALLPEAWVPEVRAVHRPYAATHALDPSALRSLLPLLESLTTPEPIRLALWLDPRAEVAALADPDKRGPTTSWPTSRPAQSAWQEQVASLFLEPFDIPWAPPPKVVPPASPEPDDASPHLQQRLKAAKSQLAAAEAAARQAASAHSQQIAGLQARLDAVQAASAQLEADFVRRLREETTAALSEQVRPWLAQPVAVEESIATNNPEGALEGLLAETDRLLQRQQQVDRHHGNRARLRDEVQRLESMLAKVQDAAAESLNPLGEWPRQRDQLVSAIRQRRGALGEVPSAAPWAIDLAFEVAQASAPSELDSLAARIRQLAEAGLLEAEARQWLDRRLTERRSLQADPVRQGRKAEAVRIGAVLRGQAAGIVLVDTYNWIGRSTSLLGLDADPTTFPEALRQLRPWLQRVARMATQAQIVLVTDGHESGLKTIAGGVMIEWTGGSGKDRADQLIANRLRHWQSGPERQPLWVVSADRKVQETARSSGATVEDPNEFTRRLVALVARSRLSPADRGE